MAMLIAAQRRTTITAVRPIVVRNIAGRAQADHRSVVLRRIVAQRRSLAAVRLSIVVPHHNLVAAPVVLDSPVRLLKAIAVHPKVSVPRRVVKTIVARRLVARKHVGPKVAVMTAGPKLVVLVARRRVVKMIAGRRAVAQKRVGRKDGLKLVRRRVDLKVVVLKHAAPKVVAVNAGRKVAPKLVLNHVEKVVAQKLVRRVVPKVAVQKDVAPRVVVLKQAVDRKVADLALVDRRRVAKAQVVAKVAVVLLRPAMKM